MSYIIRLTEDSSKVYGYVENQLTFDSFEVVTPKLFKSAEFASHFIYKMYEELDLPEGYFTFDEYETMSYEVHYRIPYGTKGGHKTYVLQKDNSLRAIIDVGGDAYLAASMGEALSKVCSLGIFMDNHQVVGTDTEF
jgi:hypothetical protein